jgi:MFS family permease
VSSALSPALAQRTLGLVFLSTFLELVGVFMLSPLLLFLLKADGVATAVGGLFAASGWVGVLVAMPFIANVTHALGRRKALWLAAGLPVVATTGFYFTDELLVWFVLEFIAGMAGGLRWVLAEALVAECAPAGQRGRWVGWFETMVGATFVLGPALLAWIGTQRTLALAVVWGVLLAGLLCSLWIPALPDDHTTETSTGIGGLRGLWHALRAHPVIMIAGCVGGFFESGISGLLPLYGLVLEWSAPQSALLVSASGLGSALMMLPMGVLADRMAQHPQQRWGTLIEARLHLMQTCALLTLLTTLIVPWVADVSVLAWPVVFLWGGMGGGLYTLSMIAIGDREQGLQLVQATAVLVMSYTLGGTLAPALGGWALQVSPRIGFVALLLAAATLGWLALLYHNRHTSRKQH